MVRQRIVVLIEYQDSFEFFFSKINRKHINKNSGFGVKFKKNYLPWYFANRSSLYKKFWHTYHFGAYKTIVFDVRYIYRFLIHRLHDARTRASFAIATQISCNARRRSVWNTAHRYRPLIWYDRFTEFDCVDRQNLYIRMYVIFNCIMEVWKSIPDSLINEFEKDLSYYIYIYMYICVYIIMIYRLRI